MSRLARVRLARLEARIPHAGEALIAATEAAEALLSPALRARREELVDLLEQASPEWFRLECAAGRLAEGYAAGMAAWSERMDALTIPAGTPWHSPLWHHALPKPPAVPVEAVTRVVADAEAEPAGERRDMLILCALRLGQAMALGRIGRAWFIE